MTFSVILLSGGKGRRMKVDTPKQYLHLQDKIVVLHALDALLHFPDWKDIVVVCEKEYESLFTTHTRLPLRFARPGKERMDSVFSGFQALIYPAQWVCIHDGARPLLRKEDLLSVLQAGMQYGAATLGTPIKMTIKEVDNNFFIKKTLDRSLLWDIQTPQVLQRTLLEQGFQHIHKERLHVTDDVSLAELLGSPVKLVQGSSFNLKITTKEDFILAQELYGKI